MDCETDASGGEGESGRWLTPSTSRGGAWSNDWQDLPPGPQARCVVRLTPDRRDEVRRCLQRAQPCPTLHCRCFAVSAIPCFCQSKGKKRLFRGFFCPAELAETEEANRRNNNNVKKGPIFLSGVCVPSPDWPPCSNFPFSPRLDLFFPFPSLLVAGSRTTTRQQHLSIPAQRLACWQTGRPSVCSAEISSPAKWQHLYMLSLP